MDEPLSNLDAKLRVQMRAEIARIQNDLGVTTIYVTHDQTEAMTMGDRVAVIRKGELQQVDTPADALRAPGQPVRRRLHRLAGDEPRRGHARRAATAAGRRVRRLPAARSRRRSSRARPDLRGYDGRTVVLGIRPEDMEDAVARVRRAGRPAHHASTVELREALGSDVVVHFTHRRAAGADRGRARSWRSTSARRRSSRSSSRPRGGESDVVARLNPRTTRAQGRADRAGRRHPPAALLRPRRRRRHLRGRSVTRSQPRRRSR